MNEEIPIVRIVHVKALHAFRDITNSTNERTLIAASLPTSGVGHTISLMNFSHARAVTSLLVLANLNSLPFDWAARLSVGGTHMSYFVVKQLPVIPPEMYLERSTCGHPWIHLVIPRVLELTYTSETTRELATDLGYQGPPFPWNEQRRLCLRAELDAIFAHIYGLSREEIKWMLDADAPSLSFPSLKQNETRKFGDFRTQGLVLEAYDALKHGKLPNLDCKT